MKAYNRKRSNALNLWHYNAEESKYIEHMEK